MKTHRIALIPGDNIGPEVIGEGRRILEKIEALGYCKFNFETFPWGAGYYLKNGRAAPENLVDIVRPFDALYFGAHGDPARVPDHISSQQLMHPIRKGLDLFANIRPVKWYAGTETPLKSTEPIDFVMVRENTEGEYSSTGGRLHEGTPNEIGMMATIVTRHASERIIRHAFETARKRNGKKYVHCVTKSNALRFTMMLWDEVFDGVAKEYPDIRTTRAHVDATAMYVVTRPHTYDVLVATNLMGDILSDEAAAVTGSIGLAASANLSLGNGIPSMFEPIHGSAPDIAGKGIANPLATILAGALMLDWLGETAASKEITRAVEAVLAAKKIRTPDLGGTSKTTDVTDAVISELKA